MNKTLMKVDKKGLYIDIEGEEVAQDYTSQELFKFLECDKYNIQALETIQLTEVELAIYEEEGEADLYVNTYNYYPSGKLELIDEEMKFIKTYKYISSARKTATKKALELEAKLNIHYSVS